jgi:hypothetical protein
MKNTGIIGLSIVLGLSACNAESDSQQGAQGDEQVGQAGEALTIGGVQSYTQVGGEAGSPTNGKKVVVSGGRIHAVYSVGGAVKYTSSLDGVSWSAPVNLDAAGASAPTIAADSAGRLGVAYIKTIGIYSYIYYTHKPSGGSWSSPIQVTTDSLVREPSMVADGTTIHLTYVVPPFVHYISFASGSPPSSAPPEYVTGILGNSVFNDSYPAVAVSAGPGGSRRVRVAMIKRQDAPGSHTIGVWYTERGSASDFGELGLWAATSQTYSGTGNAYSLSMDANPTTGDFYIAASFDATGSPRTYLYHDNTFSASPTVQFQLAATANMVSMAAARQDCVNKMRVQWSPATNYNATQFRTATWASGAAPTWLDAAPVPLATFGFASTSLLSSLVLAGTTTRRLFHSFHDISNGGSSFTLQVGYDTGPNPAPCD